MWRNKKQSLKASYYRSFLALIVVPIFLVILLSISTIRAMMVNSAIRSIKAAQDHIVVTLGREVMDVSLRLSHLVHVNNSEIMKFAAGTQAKDLGERYRSMKALTMSFNYAMAPVQDIVSAAFYMKDGNYAYLKNDIVLPWQQVAATDWYQAALEEKNMVKTGFYDSGVTYIGRNSNSLTIAAALSPGPDLDREGAVHMVVLFADSLAGDLVKQYNKEKLLGATALLDQEGEPVFDPGHVVGLMGRDDKKYIHVVSKEPYAGLQVVSLVEANLLTRDFNRVALALLGITMVLFAFFYLFSSYFLKGIIKPVQHTVEGMKEVEAGNLDVHIDPKGQAELRLMTHSFNQMARRLKQLVKENEKQQQKKHEAEIKALQSQINPHFLVNALSSIRFIAQVSKYQAIGKMAEALIKILSCSFRSKEGFYTLAEELEVLDSYIYLMKIRYSDSFEIEYHVKEPCLSCLVPRLLLQPIVENSIVHGFEGLEDMGRIQVSSYIQEDVLHICIQDNGKGMEEEEIQCLLSGKKAGAMEQGERDELGQAGIGVANVNARLLLNYGPECQLAMESEKGAYMKTEISLPVRRKGEGPGEGWK